ncbi:MAG: hypothetical protein LBU58_00285, partial [Clostridiales bacterium]|nr:hypothetical protein [Clostridiales bacterium]
MVDSQLIVLEGLPSTGKTTNARFVQIQLERNGINAEWVHEVAMPHPVLFFDEAGFTHDEYDRFIKTYPEAADILNHIAVFRKSTVGIHLPEIQWNYMDKIDENVYQALLEFDVWKFPLDGYKKFALEKWAHFTEKALKDRKKVYIIDSALFQFQIFTFLFKNRSYVELQSFINQIMEIIQSLNPWLLYLYRDNTEATIDYLEKDRGTSYLDYIWNRDKAQPYYAGKPPGAEGFKQFLRDYAGMADLLFDSFPAKKLSLEISVGNWTCHEDTMLSFLDVNRIPSPNIFPQNGVYTNEKLNFVIKIEGLSCIDPTGKTRKLFPKSHNEFYVDWLPTVLRFDDKGIIISGSQIGERWTTTG